MSLRYVPGDLLEAAETTILHGCNARGAFGSGVAGAIAKRWPWARQAYMDHHIAYGLRLGDIVSATAPDGLLRVLNAVTQESYGRARKRYVDYDAVREVMRKVEANPEIEAVAMPLIGAGLGGGSWAIIADIIEAELRRVSAVVYVPDGVVPST